MTEILKTAAKQNKQVSTIAETNNNNNVTKKGKTMSNKIQKQQEETVKKSSKQQTNINKKDCKMTALIAKEQKQVSTTVESVKKTDENIINVKKDVIQINGKKYIDYEKTMRWVNFIGWMSDKECFFENHFSNELYDDETFDDVDVEEEFSQWLIRLDWLIEDSMKTNVTLSTKAKHLLEKVYSAMGSWGLSEIFKEYRNIFDNKSLIK